MGSNPTPSVLKINLLNLDEVQKWFQLHKPTVVIIAAAKVGGIFANNSYEILKIELDRVGAVQTGERATSMLSLDNPRIDWIQLSKSMGVPAFAPTSVEEFTKIFSNSVQESGPSLIVISL